ncbi:NADP-binding protein [Dacryopinax primogenitus]|uniref:NADP-binding protein n=1 Tax=Dacryopinax primogenitus (strain DJM 731) TaxID=1858805 RepID=M5G6D8_DACPD|nr:NADP-binding protein [Dacryopinax primogenitus]EJU01392.1 NADP-binding protein [Dacryopinax primogenitus]
MSAKLVAVIGATGTQGGSVVGALLAHGGYSVRAITRDTNSAKAQALKSKGVQVVFGSLTDEASVVKAFEGVYAVFGITVPFTNDSEELQGRNIVDAAKEAKVPLLVCLFDQKSEVDKYARSSGQPTVIIHTGVFMENLIKGHLQRDASDPNRWNLAYPVLRPDVPLPLLCVGGDLGRIVVSIIDHWEDDTWKAKLTKDVLVAAPHLASVNDMISTLKKPVYGLVNDGYLQYPQQTILEELGIKTTSFETYAQEKVLPYLQSNQ